MSEEKDPLVGKYFHSFEKDGKTVLHQGFVKARVSEGVYLVQLFSFWDGRATRKMIASVEDIAEFRLYDTAREMRENHDADAADFYLHMQNPNHGGAPIVLDERPKPSGSVR